MVDIVTENAKPGVSDTEYAIFGAGDVSNLGFSREFSVNAGETVTFSCDGTGTVIDIYRIGYYGGLGWTSVTSLTNAATSQPEANVVAGSNGATECSNWSVTASWDVPSDATSGLYVGVYRNLAGTNASWIPFVVRDDEAEADIIYKFSDSTWALAYNHYGTPGNIDGKDLYGSGQGVGTITSRSHYVSYMRPIITRRDVDQTYWLNAEYPFIRWAERNGYKIKYIASKDLDGNANILNNGKIFVSAGHDEYWSTRMRDNFINWRNGSSFANPRHALFMSGNEVFWRTRYDFNRDGMWCYKDTMPGPGAHVAGEPLDPVEWTGTWRDTRRPDGADPEDEVTGTFFRMNGVYDYDAVISSVGYGSHSVWANTSLVSGDLTLNKVIGFEADSVSPTVQAERYTRLAATVVNIDGKYADDNGENYSGNGDLDWGIIAQRHGERSVTVGFGTCQWSWALDDTHDRGPATVSTDAQQFTLNLLGDFGAQPANKQAELVARTPASLDVYGEWPVQRQPLMLIGGEWVQVTFQLGQDGVLVDLDVLN